MNITAEIIFDLDQPPQKFLLHHTGLGNQWRFLADEAAVVLAPLCDTWSRPVAAPPLFDRLEIWPHRWGCPDFSQTNPVEYGELKRRFLAGEFRPQDIPMPPPDKLEQYWPRFLEQLGEDMLWHQCATEAMKRHWLNAFDEFGPGFRLFMFAQPSPDERRTIEPTILADHLERIRFRADFHNGANCQTIYLAGCIAGLLTPEEQRLSPIFIAQEEARLRKQEAFAVTEAENIELKMKLVLAETKLATLQAVEARKNLPWHSNGFRVIYLRHDNGEHVDELTLTSVFQALCQILSEQPEQRAYFGAVEPLIGARANKIDEEAGRGTMAESPTPRRLRDLLKEQQGIKLLARGVLKVETAGRKKFIKLLPPKPAK